MTSDANMLATFTKGMSLIEVLVSSFILGTGILCLLALQASALGTTAGVRHRQQASLLLMEITELSYISPDEFRELDPASWVASGDDALSCVGGSMCPSGVFLGNELRGWANTVRRSLPDAQIDILRDSRHGQMIWTVYLSWYGSPDFFPNSAQTALQL